MLHLLILFIVYKVLVKPVINAIQYGTEGSDGRLENDLAIEEKGAQQAAFLTNLVGKKDFANSILETNARYAKQARIDALQKKIKALENS